MYISPCGRRAEGRRAVGERTGRPFFSGPEMGKLKWVTKNVSFSCQDPNKFTKSVSFPSAFRVTRFRFAVSGPLTFDSFQTGSGRTKFVTEVQRSPVVNFHGNMRRHAATCGNMYMVSVARCPRLNQKITAKPRGLLRQVGKKTFVLTSRQEASDPFLAARSPPGPACGRAARSRDMQRDAAASNC